MMNSERRIDRMERVLKLVIRAGKRGRTRLNDFDEKIAMLISAHIAIEDQWRRMDEQTMVIREESKLIRDDIDRRAREVFELLSLTNEKIERLIESQVVSDKRLSALIERIGSH